MAQTKNLGTLQEKVLYFLAENPHNHKQAIQKGIEHPDDQYGSVLKAVEALKDSGCIKWKKGKSMKKVSIKFYDCTEEGAFYALARNPRANVLKILDAYKDQYDSYKALRNLYDAYGHDLFVKFIRDVDEFLPMVQKQGLEKALPYLFMKIVREASDVDLTQRKRIARESMKQLSPQMKKAMKEWAKSINEIVGE
jgi:DNA-binding PadR family transcriptional regulator